MAMARVSWASLADGAVGHGAGLEALHDLLDRFDFLNGHRLVGRLEVEQAAQRAEVRGLVVDQLGVFAGKSLSLPMPAGVLQLVDGLRVEQMVLAVVAPLVLAAGVEHCR